MREPAPLSALRAELERTNFAGRQVTLLEGAAVAALAPVVLAGAGLRSDATVLAGIGVLGLLDDVLEPRARRTGRAVSKGLRGHLGELRRGRLTTGAAKAIGIPMLCLLGAAAAHRRRSVRDGAAAPAIRGLAGKAALLVLDGAVAAGTANLANLLDLRPGRALKAVIVLAAPLAMLPIEDRAQMLRSGDRAAREAGDSAAREGRALAGTALALGILALPADLAEKGMLGDTGANALGALVGTAAARSLPVPARAGALAVLLALTIASERVSFSRVIEATPALHALDQLGRRAAP